MNGVFGGRIATSLPLPDCARSQEQSGHESPQKLFATSTYFFLALLDLLDFLKGF